MKTLTKEIIVIIIVLIIISISVFCSYSYGKYKGTKLDTLSISVIDTTKLLYTSKYGDKIYYVNDRNTKLYWVENEIGAIKQLTVK